MSRLCVIETDETEVIIDLANIIKSMTGELILDLGEEYVSSLVYSDTQCEMFQWMVEREAFHIYKMREGCPTRIKMQTSEAAAVLSTIHKDNNLRMTIRKDNPDYLLLEEKTEETGTIEPSRCHISLEAVHGETQSLVEFPVLCRYTMDADDIKTIYRRLYNNRGSLNNNSVVTLDTRPDGIVFSIINRTNTRVPQWETKYRDLKAPVFQTDARGENIQVHVSLAQFSLLCKATAVSETLTLEMGEGGAPLCFRFGISDIGQGRIYMLQVRLNELLS